MKKSETDSPETPVPAANPTPVQVATPAPFIYLGPPVRTGTLHLEPRQILKQRPAIPRDLDFLGEFLVPVKDHGGHKQRLSAKYPAAARRLAAAIRAGKE